MSNTLHATIATDTLTMAVKRISRAGNCYDNAMMESLGDPEEGTRPRPAFPHAG
jgi:hypothetical protein